jgi:hypothetical protein
MSENTPDTDTTSTALVPVAADAPPAPPWERWPEILRQAGTVWEQLPGGLVMNEDGLLPSQVISGSPEKPFTTLRAIEGMSSAMVGALSLFEHGYGNALPSELRAQLLAAMDLLEH